jgi:hypothetical protein
MAEPERRSREAERRSREAARRNREAERHNQGAAVHRTHRARKAAILYGSGFPPVWYGLAIFCRLLALVFRADPAQGRHNRNPPEDQNNGKVLIFYATLAYIRHFISAGCYDNDPWYLVPNLRDI